MSSHRHKPADLSLWDDLESADFAHASRQAFTRKVESAIETVALFVFGRNRKSCYAGVSWGKDSVTVAHLFWLTARRVPLVHLRPTNHNPDCDAVRDEYFARFPGQPYEEIEVDYSGINRNILTAQDLDAATDKRWYAAIAGVEKKYSNQHALGIRAEESSGRKMRMFRWGVESPNALAPIGRWTTQDVFAYLADNDLPVHPAYAMLGAATGGACRWPRDRIRVAEIGDTHGTGGGRAEWEMEYYGDAVRRNLKDSCVF